MNNYVMLAVAWIIGQLVYASVSVYILQKNLSTIGYWEAVRAYFKSEFGNYVIAFSGLLLLMFIMPDFLDPSIKRADLLNKEVLTFKEKLVIYQRSFAVGISAFIQHLLYVGFKKGKKAIHDYAAKNQIDDNV